MATNQVGGPLQYASAEAIARFERAATASVPGRDHAMRMAAALLAGRVPESGSLLSVGIGTGAEMSLLAAARPDWHLTGIDPSAPMVEAARDRLTREGVIGRAALAVGTVDALPAEPAFDGATCFMVLPLLGNDGPKRALLDGIAARLKPGASFVLTTVYTDASSDEMAQAWRWFQRGMGQSDAEVEALAAQVRGEIHPISSADLSKLLSAAGFTAPRQYYQALWFGGWITEKQDR
ncbi:MAG TPA: class I SAM-dependent methyltransferase [Candidatus Limnocylindrales bacterium]|nr:class I SAM-dependent methyltransferase [Candidatus Limnocylindrales bacterium]